MGEVGKQVDAIIEVTGPISNGDSCHMTERHYVVVEVPLKSSDGERIIEA